MKNKNVIVLFSGSFKVMHAGHIDLIQRYVDNPDVKEVKVFVSPSTRGIITEAISHQVIFQLINNPKVSIEKVEDVSPIGAACKFIESAKPGKYVLASSSKENDYKRIKRLIDYYKIHKLSKGVKLIELYINSSPLVYKNRTDKFEGKPISASILRQDIENNDFNNFKTNYQNCSSEIIFKIWNLIRK